MPTETAEPPTWVPGESETAAPVTDTAAPPAPPTEPPAPPAADEPEDVPGDSNPKSESRRYVVLEQLDLLELVSALFGRDIEGEVSVDVYQALLDAPDIYRIAAEPEARNTEHALRSAAKTVHGKDGVTTMVPVADRMWRPTTVRTQTDTRVSIGD